MKSSLLSSLVFYSLIGHAQPLGCVTFIESYQVNTIGSAYPFLLYSNDPRHNALGNSAVSTSADFNSIFWNTAQLAFSEEENSIGLSYSPVLRALTNGGHLSSVSGYINGGKRFSLGYGLKHFTIPTWMVVPGNAFPPPTFNPQNFSLRFGISYRPCSYQDAQSFSEGER